VRRTRARANSREHWTPLDFRRTSRCPPVQHGLLPLASQRRAAGGDTRKSRDSHGAGCYCFATGCRGTRWTVTKGVDRSPALNWTNRPDERQWMNLARLVIRRSPVQVRPGVPIFPGGGPRSPDPAACATPSLTPAPAHEVQAPAGAGLGGARRPPVWVRVAPRRAVKAYAERRNDVVGPMPIGCSAKGVHRRGRRDRAPGSASCPVAVPSSSSPSPGPPCSFGSGPSTMGTMELRVDRHLIAMIEAVR
jgi:hypothetical protein